jgi:ketosteroid isomerase-like protein
MKDPSRPSPASLVRAFYDVRRDGDFEKLRSRLAPNVRWCEPDIGSHMGAIVGAGAVIDMIRRALATTGGTFRLRVVATVETATHCSAVIAWSAEKGERIINGQEMAVFGFKNGLIEEAYFFASNIADDEAFWA